MSPRSAYANRLLRETSHAKIVGAALRLFAAYGYAGTTTRMLARAAGVSMGLLYAHFRTKGALLEEIFEQRMSTVEKSFAMTEAASMADERIERLIAVSFTILREQLDFWRLSYAVRMQPPVVEELGDQVGEWDAAIRMTLARYLRDAGAQTPQIDADVLFALIDGISQHYALQPDIYPLDAVSARIIDLYRRLRSAPVPPRPPASMLTKRPRPRMSVSP